MTALVLDLNGPWQFREYPAHARRMRDLDGEDWMDAGVPSSIYTSLIEADQIDPVELDANPDDFTHISDKPWIYRKTFDAPQKLLECTRTDLVFEGLDTVTQIWLNDKLIAKTENMFIPHRIDVTSLLREKDNRLLVKFNSPVDHARRLMKRYGKLTEFYFGYPCRSYIRKAQYQFGWDWCPPLPGCGIFRPVKLEGINHARIEDLHIRTIDCNDQYADIAVALKIEPANPKTDRDFYPLTCRLTVTDGAHIEQTLEFHPGHNRQSTIIRIDNPVLWWPNGSGNQHLYKLNIELIAEGGTIQRIEKSFGVRTAHLDRTKEKQGETFQFEINHQPIYAKGANWIPLTLFPGSQTRDDYESLLKAAAEANINILRVWGGGYYENPDFYDLCDELGIMVWQDFMFACSYYPDRQWFLDQIKTEASAVIKRLRNHTSVVLWCGNNEINWLHSEGLLGKSRKFYGKTIYQKLLPQMIAELDSHTDYVPTTPFSRTANANNPNSGTVHLWQVWSGGEPARNLVTPKEDIPRFVTEFGFQSLPDINTLKTFCPDDQLRISSRMLEKHNYQLDGNSRLHRYAADIFSTAESLAEFIYLTQLTQAREIKRYVEYLRANNQTNKGVIFWQFNDCCSAITWSAIDSQNIPKALYYYARRFFAPAVVTLIGAPDRQRPDLRPSLNSAQIIAVNDSPDPITATLKCLLTDLGGNTIDQADFPLAIGPRSHSASLKLPRAITEPADPERSLIRLTLEDHEQLIAQNTFTPLPDKYIDWPDTNLKTQYTRIDSNKWELTLESDAVAKDLQITSSTPATFSDNYFDIMPQNPRTITVNFAKSIEEPTKALQFRSVKSAH